jgi:8-oxo-dGTP diphosphatase
MEKPKVGVGVIIVKDNKVLLQKRKNAHGEESWSFPGGHLEFNESFVDCAKRETMEEVGLQILDAKFVTTTNDFFENEGKHYITVFMMAIDFQGEAKILEPDKTEQLSWFSRENFPSPLFLPIQNLLKQGFNPLNNKLKRYQHYKGNYYELIHQGIHSDTLEEYVIYKGLYDSKKFGNNPIWVKSKKIFEEKLIVDGKEIPRFKEIN